MGFKSRGSYSTGLKECTPNCVCIFCKRKRKEQDEERKEVKE